MTATSRLLATSGQFPEPSRKVPLIDGHGHSREAGVARPRRRFQATARVARLERVVLPEAWTYAPRRWDRAGWLGVEP